LIIRSQKGMALVLVLMLVALLVAIVGDFVYTVYTSTTQLRSWQIAKELRLLNESVVETGKDMFAQQISSMSYTYPSEISLPLPFEDESINIVIRDLQAKINLNALVYPNGTDNVRLQKVAKRLAGFLEIPEETLERIADWIDPDKEPRLADSEQNAKNGPLVSYEELYYIKGIKKEFIDKMREFFTVYPDRSSLAEKININTADKQVIMALAEGITESMAAEVIAARDENPFHNCSDIKKIAGFESVYPQLSALCTVKSSFFTVQAKAQKASIVAVVEETVKVEGSKTKVLLYREL